MSKRPAEETLSEIQPCKKLKTSLGPESRTPTSHDEDMVGITSDNVSSKADATIDDKAAITGSVPASEEATPSRDATVIPEDNTKAPEQGQVIAVTVELSATNFKSKVKPRSEWKNPPVKEAFEAWKPEIEIPETTQFWGRKPLPGDPRSHIDQPSARTSNGATNPPMWEDRGFRFKRGSQYVKYFGSVAPDNVEDLPEDLDQEDYLVIKLIDMRPTSKKNPTPKRTPTYYFYDGGKPKDWDNIQAVKCLNDRRAQAINRITMDAPWTPIEREFLASLFQEFPDASIWEMTERHNERFVKDDFLAPTAFAFTPRPGRTVESVRHEYVTFKPLYDRGEAPTKLRHRNEVSTEGKEVLAPKEMAKVFGSSDKALEKAWDREHENDEDDEKSTPKKKAASATKKRSRTPDDTDAPLAKKLKLTAKAESKGEAPRKKAALKKHVTKKLAPLAEKPETESVDSEIGKSTTLMKSQPKLGDVEEELLESAGAYHQDQIHYSPPHTLPASSPSSSGLALPPSSLHSPVDVDFDRVVNEIVDNIVDAAVEHAQRKRITGLKVKPVGVDASAQCTDDHLIFKVKVEESEDGNIVLKEASTQVTIKKERTNDVKVLSETPAVQIAALLCPAVEPRAARDVVLEEDYDDDEDEEL